MKHLESCNATLCVFLLATTIACASEAEDCRIGSYRLKDGSVVDIAPADKDALRWRRLADTIFSPESPGYLGRTFGNVRGVRRLEGYKLFWPEERPDIIADEARALWNV